MRITLGGRVQGVGFRPYVYRLAISLGLNGWVGNTAQGVTVEIEGAGDQVASFNNRLLGEAPGLARIERLRCSPLPAVGEQGFRLRDSEVGGKLTLVPPDLALCDACREELFNPQQNRYRYPFINCTQCGPRYSIADSLPYDRERTVMRAFPPCPACAAEYADSGDRRFHHQTITCAQCGPQLAWWHQDGTLLASGTEPALAAAVAALRKGAIIAVKGLGGFHLMLDASNSAAVARLRAFKRRPSKPLALMFPDLAAIARVCVLSPLEKLALRSAASPLLLLDVRQLGGLVPELAPGQARMGVMLPYTPLHALLLQDFGQPLVATSGNRGGEPICIDEQQAVAVFSGLVDGLLVHNRPILRGVDDSIAQFAAGRMRLLRRSRGWVPQAIAVPQVADGTIAAGGHKKNCLALAQDGQVVVSAHIGDLDTPEAVDLHARTAVDLQRLLESPAQAVICDEHPDYHASRWAQAQGLPLTTVQHHLAHLAACAVEYGLELPVCGSVWDGSGLGSDGTLWGGEALRWRGDGWDRLSHFHTFPLIGGESAAREPRRALLGVLVELLGDVAWEHPLMRQRFTTLELTVLQRAWQRGVNCPRTSSVGRLFDALASLLDVCQRQSFEGEAAMAVQTLAETAEPARGYTLAPGGGHRGVIDWRPLWVSLMGDALNGSAPAVIARAFHESLASSIALQAQAANCQTWILAGGCFQNRLLLERAFHELRAAGISPLAAADFPAGDGALALGQMAVAAYAQSNDKGFTIKNA